MSNFECKKHELDETVECIRNQSDLEVKWGEQPNALVENHPILIGYACLITLGLIFTLSHLMVFALSLLFLYFISDFLTRDVHRIVPFVPKPILFSVMYILVIGIITLVSYKVIPMMVKHLPELSNRLQIEIVEKIKAASLKWNLSTYVDVEELKSSILQASTGILHFLPSILTPLYKGVFQFVFALAINLLFYFESEQVEQAFVRNPGSLMAFLFRFVQMRLKIFFVYFRRVMGGQVIIALINTVISSVVIFGLGLWHPFLMVFVVFFCGLFPIVGNLLSNSVLTLNAFVSTGAWGTLLCLGLLVGAHKLEYFLNSRIIGGIVNLPMAVSLAAMIFCEVLLGIPGLILAIPLVLFVRHEFEHVRGISPAPSKEWGEQGENRAGSAIMGLSPDARGGEELQKKDRTVGKIS